MKINNPSSGEWSRGGVTRCWRLEIEMNQCEKSVLLSNVEMMSEILEEILEPPKRAIAERYWVLAKRTDNSYLRQKPLRSAANWSAPLAAACDFPHCELLHNCIPLHLIWPKERSVSLPFWPFHKRNETKWKERKGYQNRRRIAWFESLPAFASKFLWHVTDNYS